MGIGVALLTGLGATLLGPRREQLVCWDRWVQQPLRVGADGVMLGSRFVPHQAIVDAYSATNGRVLLQLAGGAIEEVRTEDGQRIATAIVEARRRLSNERSVVPPQLACAPGDEETVAARAALLCDGVFRGLAIAPEDAERVAADPQAAPASRAIAMRALASAPEPTRARLRVAVEETADPALNTALANALDGELTAEDLRACTRQEHKPETPPRALPRRSRDR
jgi:hypothetical protein